MSKKPKQPPVCPYAYPYSEMMSDRRGRTCRSPEAMRKQIDKALDLMFAADDFWTLESLRRLLARLALFDDAALSAGLILTNLDEATADQLRNIDRFISNYLHPLPDRKGDCK